MKKAIFVALFLSAITGLFLRREYEVRLGLVGGSYLAPRFFKSGGYPGLHYNKGLIQEVASFMIAPPFVYGIQNEIGPPIRYFLLNTDSCEVRYFKSEGELNERLKSMNIPILTMANELSYDDIKSGRKGL